MQKNYALLALNVVLAVLSLCAAEPLRAQQSGCDGHVSVTLEVNKDHPWRPPFGLDRVGQTSAVRVGLKMPPNFPVREYSLLGYRNGKEAERHSITVSIGFGPTSYVVPFTVAPDETALLARCRYGAAFEEIARKKLDWPSLEADAMARAASLTNPVDLGAILVPQDWLLVAGGQKAVVVDVAAFARHDIPDARLRAWFGNQKPVEVSWPLKAARRVTQQLEVQMPVQGDRSELQVSLQDGSREVWRKTIPAMIVRRVPAPPTFGAVETKLRYDAPISVKDLKTGEFSSLNYDTAWDPKLQDVVVFLPNGSRFVFWRGANYIPFWAGKYNTGFSYQPAETNRRESPDCCVEPLMDRELRYGRVRILESTPSRVHVRWTYPLSDFAYQVYDDQATEDFYFYPDGFGTRVMTLSSPLNNDSYQLSEFIVLIPQSAYPLEVLPDIKLDLLSLDGERRQFVLPKDSQSFTTSLLGKLAQVPTPAVYRISVHKDDPATAIYFNPLHQPMELTVFSPFFEDGELVTPAYWGEHWPLGRGSMTGAGISDRITRNPSHVSIASWFMQDGRGDYIISERSLWSSTGPTLDPLGKPRTLITRKWAWLIAQTDLPDEALQEWGRSFAKPPAIELTGARLDHPAYSLERRALRIVAERSSITMKVTPQTWTVNPVFEIDQAPEILFEVMIDGRKIPAASYAWDGAVLWIKSLIAAQGATIDLRFR